MTPKCKHDEQLLDYVYGELSDAERKIFADHLTTCSTCPAQVASFGGIRKEFQARPPIEPAGEAMQRMTALLMQAAAEQQGKAAGAVPDGGGKVLEFRSRGLRRILFHPAGGVMAVAAAALFWVVFRAQPGPPAGLTAPTATTAFEAPRAPAGAPTTVAAAASTTTLPTAAPDSVAKNELPAAKEAEKARAEATGDRRLEATGRAGLVADKTVVASKDEGLKDGDFAGLRARLRDGDSAPAKEQGEKKLQQASGPPMVATKPTKPAEPPAKPMVMAKLDLPAPATRAAAGKGSAPPQEAQVQYRSSGPAVVAMADQAYQRAGKKSAGYEAPRSTESWTTPPAAAPPPPPAAARPSSEEEPASVREGIARTEERRKQKVVDALSNQELGTMAGGAPGSAPSASAPVNDNRYAQQRPQYDVSATSAPGNAVSSQGTASPADDAQASAATATPSAANMLARGAVTGAAVDDSAAALTAAKEQLRRGQCSEASATLTRLERTQPMLHGLAETRAEWQTSCATTSPQYLERRLNNEAPEAPAPAMAAPAPYRMSKSHMAAPMPAKAALRKPSPKAPAKADVDVLK